jgi:hypothetical protein
LQWRIQFEQLTNDSQDNNHLIVGLRTNIASRPQWRDEANSLANVHQNVPPRSQEEKKSCTIYICDCFRSEAKKKKNVKSATQTLQQKCFRCVLLDKLQVFIYSRLQYCSQGRWTHSRAIRRIFTMNFMLFKKKCNVLIILTSCPLLPTLQ